MNEVYYKKLINNIPKEFNKIIKLFLYNYSIDNNGEILGECYESKELYGKLLIYNYYSNNADKSIYQEPNNITHKLIIRYLNDIKLPLKIKIDQRIFNVIAIRDPLETKELFEIYLKEIKEEENA